MTKQNFLDKFRLPNVFLLFSIIFLSCTLLIFINYFTIKILSSSRAYINGESHYSKGQKDAARHLITYLYTSDNEQWKLFKKELSVPQGDAVARVGLINNWEESVIKNGFRAGRNHEEDLDDLIWLFKYFHSVPFFAKAVTEWEKGDYFVNQLSSIGNEAHQKISIHNLSTEEQQKTLKSVSALCDELTINERNFSNTLGDGSRMIKKYLLYVNIFFILIIISSVGIYYSIMVKKLMFTKLEIEDKNRNLTLVNKELDKFVYSASHDLRSPITSLKGLVEIIKLEEDPDQIKDYLNLMLNSLNRQDQFISDIIDYSRNKRLNGNIELILLNEIFDDAIAQLQYLKEASTISIKKELLVSKINSDSLRLKIILNNLLSNAVKYSDPGKSERFISIKTYTLNESCVIEIEDNGIGINNDSQNNIFDMFFAVDHDKGSGLGLYIVKEAIDNINGNIAVESEINVGTKFTITIPHSL